MSENRAARTTRTTQATTYHLRRDCSKKAVPLWTIQPLPVWQALLRDHLLFVDPEHALFNQNFREAYDWMRGQMSSRLPDYQDHYPWWAYDYRLDLHSYRYQIGPGPHVRLGLAVPTERVLFSAYGAWHCVLGRIYLPDGQGEEEWERKTEAWDEELRREGISPDGPEPLPEPWQSRRQESWRRIFAVEELRETNTIQGCFERLDLADVVEVTKFSSAIRGRHSE